MIKTFLAYRNFDGDRGYCKEIPNSLPVGATYYDAFDTFGFFFRVEYVHLDYRDIRILCVSVLNSDSPDFITSGLRSDTRGRQGWVPVPHKSSVLGGVIELAYAASEYPRVTDHMYILGLFVGNERYRKEVAMPIELHEGMTVVLDLPGPTARCTVEKFEPTIDKRFQSAFVDLILDPREEGVEVSDEELIEALEKQGWVQGD